MSERGAASASDREVTAEHVTGTPFDLEACRTEPIHLLGRVQSHGALIALEEPELIVRTASTGCARLLGYTPAELRGRPLHATLGETHAAVVRAATRDADDGDGTATATVPAPRGVPLVTSLDVAVHRADGLLVCEYEPDDDATPVYPRVRRALRQIRGATSVADLAAMIVTEVRAMTGFDRVVTYRFDGEGPGQVIAEDKAGHLESWSGWWFPAIDVPPQARRLYLRQWIRAIADVDDVADALDPPVLPGSDRHLDLSGSILRTVSGFHLEYLRNLGVRASMSISLISEGRLWGLIACHARRPLRLRPQLRSACELLGVALSMQLVAIEEREESAARLQATARLGRMIETFSTGFPASLLDGSPGVLDLIPAGGAHVRLGTFSAGVGATPEPALIDALLARVPVVGPGVVWHTEAVSEALPDAAFPDAVASGVLVLPLSSAGDAVVWFRPELPRTQRWAVDPEHVARLGPRGERLTPRGSQTVWLETVRGRSTPWSIHEREIAAALGRAISELILRRAAELAALNAELERSNAELDAFAYAASHDFKEPLRGISHSASFVLEDDPGLDEQSRRRLETIRVLAHRMDELLGSILRYSRVGRGDLRHEAVDLDGLLDEVTDLVGGRLADAGIEMRRPDRLPVVAGDRAQLREVFTNLLVNAAKYAGDPPRWVRVGLVETDPVTIAVDDNGIGIPPSQHEEVFALFRRVHPETSTSGLGAGLAIARKIVERHGGRMWVESERGQGASFRFTLPPPD